MTIRRTAPWQQCLDERILEYLRDESWSTAAIISRSPGIHATKSQVRERCLVLADADLVGFLTPDNRIVEITTLGRQYLNGDVDLGHYPRPRKPQHIPDTQK